jgi:hypothetical protein
MKLPKTALHDGEGRVMLYVACGLVYAGGFETRVYSLHSLAAKGGTLALSGYSRRKLMVVAHPKDTTYPVLAEALVAQCDLIAMQNGGAAYVIQNPQRLETLRAGRFKAVTKPPRAEQLRVRTLEGFHDD